MPETSNPNILIILSDDQGPWALGCAGNSELRTPNLDSLAAGGTRFTNFFCASPVCSPARASFLTGRIPSQHGVHDWLKSGNIKVEDGVTWCGRDRPIEYLEGMTGFTDILAANGYACGLSGKWHLGDSGTPQKGHSYWFAHSLGGDNYRNYFMFENSPELVNRTQYVTDYFTDKAIDFLDHQRGSEKPFCLSVHYTAPHSPWSEDNHPEDVWATYASCPFESVPDEPVHPWAQWKHSPEHRRNQLTGYFTAVTAMDTNIGRLLDKLDEMGIRDNTLVVFLSDNGMNMGHHGIWGKGNGTFPVNMYDTSVKIPFIASLPGRVPQGVVHEGLCSQYDFMPTILDYLGFENPDADQLPGQSFAAALRGEADQGAEQVVVCDEYGPVRMIRDHEWKYVHRYPYGPHELYSLNDDPDERQNLVDEDNCSEIVGRMRGKLDEWFATYVAPDLDGAKLPVTGRGQIDAVRAIRDGRESFVKYPGQ